MIVRIADGEPVRLPDDDARPAQRARQRRSWRRSRPATRTASTRCSSRCSTLVRARGQPLDDDELEESDVILPPPDTSFIEAAAEFTGEGLIPTRPGSPRAGTSARAPPRPAARRRSGPAGAARARSRAAGAARGHEGVEVAALVVVDPVDGLVLRRRGTRTRRRARARRSRRPERARDRVDADDEVLEVRVGEDDPAVAEPVVGSSRPPRPSPRPGPARPLPCRRRSRRSRRCRAAGRRLPPCPSS